MKLYIAYGSNLNMGQMAERCPDAMVAGVGTLKDYQLVFRGNSYTGVANIEPCRGKSVPVALWWISKRDEQALDCYEGYPCLYTKKFFSVRMSGERKAAMAYTMTGNRKPLPPSAHYLDVIAAGYDYFKFDMAPLLEAVGKSKTTRFSA